MAEETQTDLYSDSPGRYWKQQLDHARKVFEDWDKRGDRVVSRYRDERAGNEQGRSKFNILWSNIQVLTPSLYGRPAKPEVSRRFRDQDVSGRVAATILERALEYEVEQFPDFDAAMRGVVEDRLLPGRGTAWVRFVEINESELAGQQVDRAHAPVDYVYWKDFLHSPARTWSEVWWVARCAYLTRDEGVTRFGDVFKNVKLGEYREDQGGKEKDKAKSVDKAKVWEIWNKRTQKVCWLAEDYPETLDERDDPLKLEGFFPCPEPLYATTSNGSLVPVPDYAEYQDQAAELDRLTARIQKITEAIKAVGVFNSEYKELRRLFNENTDNTMLGVTSWAAFAEKQGLKGAVDILDITPYQQALGTLLNVREAVKQTIYEICGISDIMRGSTKAEETLGAQDLKANFGSLRLRSSQVDVARFATDIFRLKAQLMCRLYPGALLVKMSAIEQTQDGKDPQKVAEALNLLANSTIRDFHIAIESDSLAQINDAEEKASAAEAILAIGGFLKEAIPMVSGAPETLPMASEMLLYLVRRHKAGRALEAAIEQAMMQLQQKAIEAQANPQPSPEEKKAMIEAQAKAQEAQLRAQVDTQAAQMKAQFDQQVQAAKLEQEARLETLKSQQEKEVARLEGQLKLAVEQMKDETERYKADLDASTKLQIANIQAEAQAQAAQMQAESQEKANQAQLERTRVQKGALTPDKTLPDLMTRVIDMLDKLEQRNSSARERVFIRDASGRLSGMKELPPRKESVQ